MDDRVELANMISEDLLKEYTREGMTFDDLGDRIEVYSKRLNTTVRNFYEVESMNNECPLFQLFYYLKNGADSFRLTEKEFEIEIDGSKREIVEMFGVIL